MKAERPIPDQLFIVEGEAVEKALRRAVRHALLMHKRAGNTVAVWEGGAVKLIPAEQIEVEDALDAEQTEEAIS